jgi:hypothetical protein
MMNRFNSISFSVFPSPDTNDHEVRLFVDGKPFIAEHWPNMMGMDPDDLLSYRELVPRDPAHEATVVRCGCGIVGCGSAWVRISVEGDRIIWDSWQGDEGNPPAPALVFARDQYMQAVKDAVEDHSWETPDRTAARILRSLVDHSVLARSGLNYQWASGRIRDATLTISLSSPLSDHQILVHVPWHQQSPDEIAREAADVLKEDPNQWRDIAWYGTNSTPPFNGPAWQR